MYNKPNNPTLEQEVLNKIMLNRVANSTHKIVNLMSTLELFFNDYDVLFHNFFGTSFDFSPATKTKQPHPVNIFYDKDGLHFEIACTGLSKDDVSIDIEDDTLKISHTKPEKEESTVEYIYRGLSQRSFSLGYKIASKFDLSKTEAILKNGLLLINIPITEQAKPKKLIIK